MSSDEDYIKGRGAQFNTHNPYSKQQYVVEHIEGVDEPMLENSSTELIPEFPKKIINEVKSPDIPFGWSMNPYQGCEHGCVYCYARNTHQYWGYSAGLDFERKIVVKENAPDLLVQQLEKKSWKAEPIMFSGNTDLYQPIERKLKITRRMLEICAAYKQPLGIITKNSLILRDKDILEEMAKNDLVRVAMSITTLDDKLRSILEPRTSTAKKKLQTIRELTDAGIPVNVMMAPIIPGLTNHEIPELLKAAAEHGALDASYTMLRLNGPVGEVFEDWVRKNLPNRADKILNQTASVHGGSIEDNRFKTRMRGEGNMAEMIRKLSAISKEKYFADKPAMPKLRSDLFVPRSGKQTSLF